MKKAIFPLFIVGAIVLGTGALALFGFAFMWLWNWLMPELFNLPVLSFWQSVGLLVLSKIIFSGVGGHHEHKADKNKDNEWKKRFERKIGLHHWKCGERKDEDTASVLQAGS